jgi:hypothetical protein
MITGSLKKRRWEPENIAKNVALLTPLVELGKTVR